MHEKFKEIRLKKGEVVKITPDMIIADVIAAYPAILPVFEQAGIHCVGCYASAFESIQEGAIVHGLDAKKLCQLLNKEISKKRTSQEKKKIPAKKK